MTELLINFGPGFTPKQQVDLETLANRALQKCLEQVRFYSGHEALIENLATIPVEINRNSLSEARNATVAVQSTMDPLQDEQLIHHELIHVFQSQIMQGDHNLFNRVPKWFFEGMAVALSGQGMVYTREALNQLLAEFPLNLDPDIYLLMERHRSYPMDIGLYDFGEVRLSTRFPYPSPSTLDTPRTMAPS